MKIRSICLLLTLLFLLGACARPEAETPSSTAGDKTEESLSLPDSTPSSAPDPVPDETETAEEVFSPETKRILAYGIDVSKWQGNIDWKKVSEAGVEFSMIRIGYGEGNGACGLDPFALRNLQEATKHGIHVGVYLYSAASTPEEAEAEAEFVLEKIAPYSVTYPVVIDVELGGNASQITPRRRTQVALGFLRKVQEAGYQGMLYALREEFEDPALWDASLLLEEFPVWIADYAEAAPPDAEYPETEYDYAMWQYSCTGRVSGIAGDVDRNVSYHPFEEQGAK
ncbi:MAG: hypothetical protein IKC69_05740 [Clostridia bacterium]|nr:hypothetical protein [Clostridia bacterium]